MDPNKLPKDLGSQDPITLAKIKALWANMPMNMGIPQLDGLSLQKGTVNYQPDNTLKFTAGKDGASADLNTKNFSFGGNVGLNGNWQLNGQTKINNAIIRALKNNHGWNASAEIPAFGGNLTIGAGQSDGINNYRMQYQRNF